MDHDVYWCDGCRRDFPLKRLKSCGACLTVKYCSVTCQAAAWKGGHKKLCREIVVQKDLLKGWAHTWRNFLRWMTVCALDLGSRPGSHHNRCLEIQLRKTGSDDLTRAYEVLNGHIEAMDVAETVIFEPDAHMGKEDVHNQIYLALLVKGEEGELIDAIGLAWELPNLINDTPERPEMWVEYCVKVLRSVVANSKPRHAIRDATFTMETTFLVRGELDSELC